MSISIAIVYFMGILYLFALSVDALQEAHAMAKHSLFSTILIWLIALVFVACCIGTVMCSFICFIEIKG